MPKDPFLLSADALAAAASVYLRQVNAYTQGLAEPDAGTREGLAREERRRAAVVAAEAGLLRALEALYVHSIKAGAERGESAARQARAAATLRDRCAAFLEAERERGRASLRFRRSAIPLADLERAAAEASAAEGAMRLALRNYELQRV